MINSPAQDFYQHETTQISKTIQAFSSTPISLKMAADITGIKYESICWRTWELHNRSEIFYVGKSVCAITKRMSKFYITKN